MKRRIKFIEALVIVQLFACYTIEAQQLNKTLEFYERQNIDLLINKSTSIIHTGFKPLTESAVQNDSTFSKKIKDRYLSDRIKKSWFYRKLRTEDLVDKKWGNITLKINPLFDLHLKKSKDYEQTFFKNTRGIELKGDIGQNVSFYTSFYENQAKYEPHIANYVDERLVVPGQGAVKKKGNSEYDFSRASAYLSVRATDWLSIQAGHSKHFIGEGYRSLLLSDNTFNYPFLKTTLSFGKFQYIILWNQYELFDQVYYNYHNRKYGAITYLSWVPKPGIEISLFENIIWPGNQKDKENNFNVAYFNPVLLSRTGIYGLNDEKNVLLGLNSRLRIYDYAMVFGQFALDNYDKNKEAYNNFSYQIGFKHYDLFHGKLNKHSLFLQSEYNYIAPYTYTWKNKQQSYSHYNQPLAHPAGSGLKEFVGIVNYRFSDISIKLKANYIINSLDTTATNFGSDIFLPNTEQPGIISHQGNTIGQGVNNKILNIYSELAITLNPSVNMQLFVSYYIRKTENEIINEEERFLTVGFRTNINNYYFDF